MIKTWKNTNTVSCQLRIPKKREKKDISIGEAALLGEIFRIKIKEITGEKPAYEDIIVTSSEFNEDYAGLRIDGAECITLNSMKTFEKLYNKGSGNPNQA